MINDTFTVAIFSNKGGSGKTTIAVHLALAWAQGAPTALLDVDPQGTATEWLKRRPADLKSPLAVPATGREAIQHALQIAWLLGEADLIVVPTRATAADLVTLGQTIDLVHASKRKAGFVLNAFKPNLVEAKEIAPILAKYSLPVIGALGDRIAHSRGLPAGLGGHELGDESASEEVVKLAKKVLQARTDL
jgi:chromosome partitioning protein